MPRVIGTTSEEKIELGELVEMLETGDFDPRDEENFASWGEALKKLANNRTFLTDMVVDELKRRCSGQLQGNQYSSQVIMLHGTSRKFILRANFWPAMDDSIVRHSGTDPFFYGLPHDHNFSFLTVGYMGPGYWSDYYEYDYEQVHGYPGEKVDLSFVERARLDLGKVMLYRAHRDVHLQLPADAMSISINILETSVAAPFRDQYRFDIDKGEVGGILTHMPLDPMLAVAAFYGDGAGVDLLDHFARAHPSERIRFVALKARASAVPDLDDRIAVFAEATGGASRLIAEMARQEIDRLEGSRAWIAGSPRTLQSAA